MFSSFSNVENQQEDYKQQQKSHANYKSKQKKKVGSNGKKVKSKKKT